MTIEGYLTTKEAAERLGVSEQYIRNLITDGTLESVKIGSMRFIREEVIATFTPKPPGRPRKSDKPVDGN